MMALELAPASPELTAAGRRRMSEVALRVFGRLADRWSLGPQERRALLGVGSTSTYHKWIRDPQHALLPRDTLERVSHLLGIHAALRILLPSNEAADAWLRTVNGAPLFAGRTPLERMLAGNVSDLYVVRQYLDAVRGGWA